MNFSASLVERTIVAVDYFINRAISGAWESVCRSALGYKRQQPLPEEDYGGGDICSFTFHGGRSTARIERAGVAQRHQLAAVYLNRIISDGP
ncbi:hypothetical protein QA640_44005 (plasmid) [Bradyrhizobium sp. CB82]|uniref:hypothetical protein n=1 Tax=Bradyrhizobium sp. CB82 TaxID=3039159 RepID=UPI0024B0C34F|nr:hypothetical protein [Bradyrhizobium sp. CB82]WFU45803.1 hypothetical protein QA640_44005 [Bradyrhizobium sp. CB82]